MALQLESLQNFLVLAETGSFTAAAAQLYMTQQALSRQIAALERRLGQTLIVRNQGQGQQLTPAGELLRAELYPLLAGIADFSLVPPVEQRLHIAAVLGLDADILGLLENWTQADTQLKPEISLLPGGPGLIEQGLLTASLDLGLLPHPPEQPDLLCAALQPSAYVIVGRPELKADWDQLDYLDYAGNPASLDTLLNVWPESRWPRRIIASADIGMAIELARHGAGAIHVPQLFVPADLVVLCHPPFQAEYTRYLVWAKSLSGPADQLRQAILDLLGLSDE